MRTLSTNSTSTASFNGHFFLGCDLGQKRDFSAVAVVEKQDQLVHLIHLRRFRLGTEYSSVLGYLKRLDERLSMVHRVLIDQTGVVEVFVEEARKLLKNAQGVMLSLPKKQEIMVYLKKVMQEQRLRIPFDRDLMNEMNSERYELTKTGQVQFSHSAGTHDDRLWALALAVYASRPEIPEYHPVVLRGRVWKPWVPRPTGWGWPENWNPSPGQAAAGANRPGKPAAGVEERVMCLRCWKPKTPVKECQCKD